MDIFERFAEAFRLVSDERIRWEREGELLSELARSSGTGAGRILDLACGNGFHARRLALRGFTVVGVDINPGPLKAGAELAGGDKVEWRNADITQPIEGEYDLALLVGNTLSLFHDEESMLRAVAVAGDALPPRGALVIHTIDFDYLREHPVSIERSGELDGEELTFEKTVDASPSGAVIRITVTTRRGGESKVQDATQLLYEWNTETIEVAATNADMTLKDTYGGLDKTPREPGKTKDVVLVFVKGPPA
jgi:SAM-dependent methyltransferase